MVCVNRSPIHFLLPGILLATVCFSGPSHTNPAEQTEFIPGKVIPKVACKADPSITYCLYLPGQYTPGATFPVLIAFDPGGSGQIPVEKYQSLAERNKCILLGSLDMQNGTSLDRLEVIVNVLLDEVRVRFKADQSRIYSAGFSGGSRVASILGFFRGGIRGIIGCGAGLPAFGQPPRLKTNYYGITGTEDFNYLEMVQLPSVFDSLGIRNSVEIFPGDHQWPPVEVFGHGLTWHFALAMQEGLLPKNDTVITAGMEIGARNIQTLHMIPPGSLKKEKDTQELFMKAITGKDIPWWKNRIGDLQKSGTPGTDSLMNIRFLHYISMLSYTYAKQALSTGNKPGLHRLIHIYELADPGNAYIPVLKQKLNELP